MSLPDQLTVARVAAVPIVVLLFAWDFPNHAYWATAVFVVAMATDQIDGWLARRRGVSSALGKLLDPVADKVLVLAALVMLIGEGVAPAWMIALIVVREILVSGLRLAAVERGVVLGARDLGRAKTWAQALAATVAGLAAAGMWSEDVAWWALLAALAFLERRCGFDVHARSIATARLGLRTPWTTGCERCGTSTISMPPRHGCVSD